jgi:hypothetical protein
MIRLLIAALSAVVGALAVALLFMLAGLPHSLYGLMWGGLIFVIGFTVARVCLSLGLNTSAAFEKGAREAAVEGRGDSLEATGRRAGAVVGKGLNKVARIGAPKASPTPTPSPNAPSTTADTASGALGPAESPSANPEPPKPEVTVDKAARVIGSMVGRRVAQRRNKP